MVICSRCQQPVDETVRDTCPLCYTPISVGSAQQAAAPPPQAPAAAGYAPPAPQSGVMPLNGPAPTPVAIPIQAAPLSAPLSAPTLGANQRMTLSGDVIEAPAPMSSQPSPGNSQYVARPAGVAPRGKETPTKESGGGAGRMAIIVLLLLALGAGGWYYWMHRTNPADQARKFLAASANNDYKTQYELVDMSEAMKTKYPTAQAYEDEMKTAEQNMLSRGPQVTAIRDAIKDAIQSAKVGDAKITGDTAAVPVTVAFNFAGQSINSTISLSMKNLSGIWKVSSDTKGVNGGFGMGLLKGGK